MSFLKRTGFVFLLLVMVFVGFEIFLRLGGFVYMRWARPFCPDAAQQHGKAVPIIMCLGDSFTFGLGADRDESYPDVLGRLLAGRARVVNRGRLGANTHVLLDELPGLIAKDRPDIIVLLAGLNNGWNSQGFYSFVSGSGSKSAGALDWIAGLRTVKLFRIGFERLKALGCGSVVGDSKRIMALGSEQELLDEINRNPGAPLAYRALSRFYLARDEHAHAEEFLKQSIIRNQQVPELYEYLADMFLELGRERDAVLAVFDGIERYPKRRRFYDTSLGIFKHIRDPRALNLIKERFGKLADDYALGREFYALFSSDTEAQGLESLTWRWVMSDIGKIADLCRVSGVELVLLNYPCPGEHERELSDFAAKQRIVFIDQFGAFAGLDDSSAFFVSDGHCSAKGYEFMARNVAQELERQGVLAD